MLRATSEKLMKAARAKVEEMPRRSTTTVLSRRGGWEARVGLMVSRGDSPEVGAPGPERPHHLPRSPATPPNPPSGTLWERM